VDVLRIAGVFSWGDFAEGDASKVLVVVVLVLGLLGRKWWMDGWGGGGWRVRKQMGERGCADKKGEGGRGEDERVREGESERASW